MDLRKDIFFYANLASFPTTGAVNELYVDKSTGIIYSWSGSAYVAAGAGGLKYLGLWNANTNSPSIKSGTGNTGEYYIVGTPGTTNIDGISDWGLNDWIIFGGSAWQKIDNSETSVATIYTSNGTVTGNRTVNLNGNTLRFSNGVVEFDQGSTNSGEIRLYEDSDFGSNKVTLRAAQAMAADTSLFFPPNMGSNGYVLTTDGAGNTAWSAAAGGLTKFTEAENTSAPNGTVYVDSLTAAASSTNADFAILPKGNGAILADIPDNLATGGNKRGQYAVDLSSATRINGAFVASGNYSVISGGRSNAAIGTESGVASGYYNIASGDQSNVSGGEQNTSSGSRSHVGGGYNNSASSSFAFVGGGNSNAATAYVAFIPGGYSNVASNNYSCAIGMFNTSSGEYSSTFGISNVSNATAAIAFGNNASTLGIKNRIAISSSQFAAAGDSQISKFLMKVATTGNTATSLTTDGASYVNGTNNYIALSNQSAFRFKGTIIGKQSGSTNAAVWDVDGFIVRGANAAATTLVVSNVTVVSNVPAWGTPTLAADTTIGCLNIQVTGAAATNIRWMANIETTEVIYA